MIHRPDGLRSLAARYANDPIVLTLGGTIREMRSVAGRRPNHLIILDAMGQPAAIGLGLALGLEDDDRFERVVVVEGDGSLLMGMTALATIGHLRPRKLLLIVFDNGVYLATGGQPTAARDADYAAIARACGWPAARDVQGDDAAFGAALDWADEQEGPVLLRVAVEPSSPPTSFILEDPVVLGSDFMRWLADPDASGSA